MRRGRTWPLKRRETMELSTRPGMLHPSPSPSTVGGSARMRLATRAAVGAVVVERRVVE